MPLGFLTNWHALKTLMKKVAFSILLTLGEFRWFINQVFFHWTKAGWQALFKAAFPFYISSSCLQEKPLKCPKKSRLQKWDLVSLCRRLENWKIKPVTLRYMSPSSRISSIKSCKNITGRQIDISKDFQRSHQFLGRNQDNQQHEVTARPLCIQYYLSVSHSLLKASAQVSQSALMGPSLH